MRAWTLGRAVAWCAGASKRLASLGFALPALIATLAIGALTIQGVLAKCGHAAVPLDDAFIHFQYAKRLATGHFFSFSEGDGFSSGATSLLWPLALAPLYLVGLRGQRIIWAAWALSWFALFGLAVETYRLAERLAGRGAALAAAAMVICFGGYVWCATSGMEVVPLAWLLATAARRAADWGESAPDARSVRARRSMIACAVAAPLLRPEGALATVMIAAALALFPRRAQARATRLSWPALACTGLVVPPLLNLAFTGHAASSTTLVKWLPTNPYYATGADLFAAVAGNVRLLLTTLLDGREWSAVFVPSGARPFALAALAAIPAAGWLRGRSWRAALVLFVALGILVPCTYLTFLWNRLRYLWPFAFAWFVGVACLARVAADALAVVRPRLRAIGPVLAGIGAGALATRLGWTMDDVATSASAIDRQQVALGHWVSDHLDGAALVGVNDTGALAYVGGKRTFDIVGLTTPGEAPYWVAGAGSRFEHYERLHRESPARLPTHFVVYPAWMACEPLLGDELFHATVTNQTILGGTTMTAYVARYDRLGSGDRPAIAPGGALLDDIDVADLESERAHAFVVGRTRETENVALEHEAEDGREIADGARIHRTLDQFTAHGSEGHRLAIVGRWTASDSAEVEISVGGVPVGRVEIEDDGWTEKSIDVPAALSHAALDITVRAIGDETFGSAHYWVYGVESDLRTP
jgi:hypothetical protein